MSNTQNTTGYRVIDPEGGTYEFPDARSAHVDRCDLYLTDENSKTVAIFHRWEHVERIEVAPSPSVVNVTITAPHATAEEIAAIGRRFGV